MTISLKLRNEIIERDKHTCQTCLTFFKMYWVLEVHHIIPRRKKGLDSPNNLITVCQECHLLIELESLKRDWKESVTKVNIGESTRKRIADIGKFGETVEDVLKRVLDFYESKKHTL